MSVKDVVRLAVDSAAAVTPWAEPEAGLLAPETVPPPPFPDVLPSGWKEWAVAAAEGAGCPIDYVGITLFCVAAALIGNARRGRPWEGWDEPLAIFAALIGRPSSGKSPALDVLTKPIAVLEKEENEDW